MLFTIRIGVILIMEDELTRANIISQMLLALGNLGVCL